MTCAERRETMASHKDLKMKYKTMKKPAGAFQIRNLKNGRLFITAGPDLKALMTRHRFQLKLGSHRSSELQRDWNETGEESFAFEVLEELKEEEGVQGDCRDELRAMGKKWCTTPEMQALLYH
jgi:hypothetical protein